MVRAGIAVFLGTVVTVPSFAADLGTDQRRSLLADGSYTTWDWRVEVGCAVPVKSADVRGVPASGFTPERDQQLDGHSAFGPHLGVRFTRGRHYWGSESATFGWNAGVELAYDGHHGVVTWSHDSLGVNQEVDDGIWCHALSVNAVGGFVMRFDPDGELRLRPHRMQVEIQPILGLGVAAAAVDTVDNGLSDPGVYIRYGLASTLSYAVTEDWGLSLALGYLRFQTQLEWDDTGASYVEGEGLFLNLGAIFQL